MMKLCSVKKKKKKKQQEDKTQGLSWLYMDSGASEHYLSCASFDKLAVNKTKCSGTVKGPFGHVQNVSMMGDCVVTIASTGYELKLKDAVRTDGMDCDVWSIGKLDADGYTIDANFYPMIMAGKKALSDTKACKERVQTLGFRCAMLTAVAQAECEVLNQRNGIADAALAMQPRIMIAKVWSGDGPFLDRIHAKCGHVYVEGGPLARELVEAFGAKAKTGLSKRCAACTLTKIHKLPHTRSSPLKPKYDKPGQMLHIDCFLYAYTEHSRRQDWHSDLG